MFITHSTLISKITEDDEDESLKNNSNGTKLSIRKIEKEIGG